VITLEALDASAQVSVVMAVRDEESHIEAAVRSVLDNGFTPGVQAIVAVGPSRDRTRALLDALAQGDRRITVVDNPHGGTPQGLNVALAHADTDVVVRMDGHSVLPVGYIASAVRTLTETGAANVGGRMAPEAQEPWPRAVAVAMRSAWGIGGASHRIGGTAGPADSVFLGAFRRAAIMDVGGFDEHFVRAQDWELNLRLREAGYTVWFEPQMHVAYHPRASWRALARQFYRSGQWRREVGRKHHMRPNVRYLAPPAVVVAVSVGAVLGTTGIVLGAPWLVLGWIAPAGYVAGVLVATLSLLPQAGRTAGARLPAVLITMHVAWGAGFLRGVR